MILIGQSLHCHRMMIFSSSLITKKFKMQILEKSQFLYISVVLLDYKEDIVILLTFALMFQNLATCDFFLLIIDAIDFCMLSIFCELISAEFQFCCR